MNYLPPKTNADWSRKAYDSLRRYRYVQHQFMTEDVRVWAEAHGLPPPPDSRAWGPVIRRALEDGLITRIGYGKSSANQRPMPVWGAILDPRRPEPPTFKESAGAIRLSSKISASAYQRLREIAAGRHRTIGGMIEYWIQHHK